MLSQRSFGDDGYAQALAVRRALTLDADYAPLPLAEALAAHHQVEVLRGSISRAYFCEFTDANVISLPAAWGPEEQARTIAALCAQQFYAVNPHQPLTRSMSDYTPVAEEFGRAFALAFLAPWAEAA
jgi:hypothetical protein